MTVSFRMKSVAVYPLTLTASLQTIILWIMHFIPGLRLRVSANCEAAGIDDAEMGEPAYDYVRLEQAIGHPADDAPAANGEMRESGCRPASRGAASVGDSLDTQQAP